jgi:hypothetical protein
MAKKTRPLSGQSQRKYFRDLLQGDEGVTREAAARLTEICADELAHIQVRTDLMTARIAIAMLSRRAGGSPKSGAAPATPVDVPSDGFDPHAFSLIVVMTKEGKDGLLAKLREVGDAHKLRAIAKAQHVAIDAELTDTAVLCAAILAGTERRIAGRKAAAS